MAPPATRITSVGFIGSGRLAERIARKLVKNIPPQQKFCYKKQRLVSTLLASDPSQERRKVFDGLGFKTTEQNQQIITDCDVVFIGTNIREALGNAGISPQTPPLRDQLKNTLFVSLMGDLPADQVGKMIGTGAKVIRMMPQNYLERKGLRKGVLPEKAWATARNEHASAEDLERVMEIAGIAHCVELNDRTADLWAFNVADAPIMDDDVIDLEMESHVLAADEYGPDFHDEYVMGEYIGKGRFAYVYQATHRVTGKPYAVKCVKNEELSSDGRDTLIAEVAALSRLTHPNVITHHGFYSEDDNYYLVLDHCDAGSLRRLMRDQGTKLSEALAKDIVRQLIEGIAYCHSMGHVHRDIKAENVLLATDSVNPDRFVVKLADFGLSKELDLTMGYLQDECGTPQYLSPEIVAGRTYGKPSDIWSAGILTYMLISGRIPFGEANDEAHLRQLIRSGAVMYHYPEWQQVSPDARDFVQRMLDIDPESRATATELLQHKWLQPA